jgi:hypothetical protein
VATEAYAVCARRTERRDVHVAETLAGGAAEGSYEQEAAVVEGEEMEREDERGAAKRPDLNDHPNQGALKKKTPVKTLPLIQLFFGGFKGKTHVFFIPWRIVTMTPSPWQWSHCSRFRLLTLPRRSLRCGCSKRPCEVRVACSALNSMRVS